jgi:GDP-L-fucose synthase
MNTLITGGNGLIGTQLNGILKLTSKDCDLRDFNSTKKTFEKYKEIYQIDSVIHTAAKVGGLGYNMSHKGDFFYDNIMINTNVVEVSRQLGIKKLVSFLSTCIFPDNVEYPLTEDKIHLGPPHNSNYPYAYAKRMSDIQIRSYREQYGINYISVIPTNVYGPNDNFNLNHGHVLPSLLHKCFLAKRNNTPFVIWGTGRPLREFIYSKDIARLTEWALNNYDEDEPIIFSTSQEISIKDCVDLIVEIMNYKGKVIWDETKPDGQFRKPTDNQKMKKYLPNFTFTKIEDGLSETINWLEDNYNVCRK